MKNNIKLNIKPEYRIALYIISGLLMPVMSYLFATGVIDGALYALWTAENVFICGLASINVNVEKK